MIRNFFPSQSGQKPEESKFTISFLIFLLLIILSYEIHTREFTKLFNQAGQSESGLNSTNQNDEKHLCDRKVKLAEYDQLPIIFLNSFPGSGNT